MSGAGKPVLMWPEADIVSHPPPAQLPLNAPLPHHGLLPLPTSRRSGRDHRRRRPQGRLDDIPAYTHLGNSPRQARHYVQPLTRDPRDRRLEAGHRRRACCCDVGGECNGRRSKREGWRRGRGIFATRWQRWQRQGVHEPSSKALSPLLIRARRLLTCLIIGPFLSTAHTWRRSSRALFRLCKATPEYRYQHTSWPIHSLICTFISPVLSHDNIRRRPPR